MKVHDGRMDLPDKLNCNDSCLTIYAPQVPLTTRYKALSLVPTGRAPY